MKIEGKNIHLRPVTKRDARSLYEHARDKEISRYTFVPHPYTVEDALRFIRHSRKQARAGKEYHFGIALNATGQIVGMVGMEHISQQHQRAEVGYWLGKSFWGRGYASEALRLMLKFAFEHLKLNRITAGVMHPNTASARMLKRVGFTCEGRFRRSFLQYGQWMDELRFGILKEEFESQGHEDDTEQPSE